MAPPAKGANVTVRLFGAPLAGARPRQIIEWQAVSHADKLVSNAKQQFSKWSIVNDNDHVGLPRARLPRQLATPT